MGHPCPVWFPDFPCSGCILLFILFPLLLFSCVCLCHLSSLSLCAHAHKIFISHVYFLFSVLIFLPSCIVNKLYWLQMFPIWQHLRLRFFSHTAVGVLAPSSSHAEVCDGAIPHRSRGWTCPPSQNLGSQPSLSSAEQKRNRNWAVILGVVMNGLCCSGLFGVTGWRRGGLGSVQRLTRSLVLCVPFQLLLKALEWWVDVGHVCFPRVLSPSYCRKLPVFSVSLFSRGESSFSGTVVWTSVATKL